jgi:SAM-dependent methyltransferase
MGLLDWLSLPERRGISDLDDRAATVLHAGIIRRKSLLRRLYIDFYDQFRRAAGEVRGSKLVELGSGGGFIKEVIPNVTTSDVIDAPGVDLCFSAMDMPFDDASVDAFLMIDVLHHLPDARAFFAEATRCLRAGGKVVMIEPANTPWSRFIYGNFHHEAFEPDAGWSFPSTGRLSGANGALPWIIFCRDRARFEDRFPLLRINRVRPHTPFRYLVSGGLRLRQLLPGFAYPLIKALEAALSPLREQLGMFMTVELERLPR